MAKVKLPRKSTNIDMTAMCDVAFLLLTFFMLATKFKPDEPVQITTPSSVSSKIVPDKDVLLLTFDKDGKIYLQMDNPVNKQNTLQSINRRYNLGLSAQQINNFINGASVGVPFSQLPFFLSQDQDEVKKITQPGIPTDSVNNELNVWVQAALTSYAGKKLNIVIKGDNLAQYATFKKIVDVLKKNDQFKFELITTPEDAPQGTALWATRNKGNITATQ